MRRTFDELLESHVGALGAWQLIVFVLVSFCCTAPLLQYQQLALITPPHFCAQPTLEAAGWGLETIRNLTVPRSSSASGGFDECHQFNISAIISPNMTRNDKWSDAQVLDVIPCQHGWSFDDREITFRRSLPREFNLVCDRKMLVSWCGSAYLLGMIPGPAIAGFFADRFGRRTTGVVVSVLAGSAAIGTSFLSTDVTTFWILRFFTGVAASASNVVGYIWCAEFTTIKHQNVFNLLFNIAANQLADAHYILFSFLLQEWRVVHAIVAAPQLMVLFFPFFIPESPRWLLAVDKRKRAAAALARVAAANRLCSRRNDGAAIKAAVMDKGFVFDECGQSKTDEVSWTLLFTNKLYRLRLLLLMFLWVAVNVVYYGLSFFSVRLKANPFVTAACLSCFAIVASLVKTLLFVWFEHKKALFGSFVAAGMLTAACTVALHIDPNHVVNVALATVAYGCSASIFYMLYTVVPGQFPTATQNFAMGICYGFSRFGAASSTFVEKLDTVTGRKWVPMIVLTVVLASGALMVFWLPLAQELQEIQIEMEIEEKYPINNEEDKESQV